MKSFAQYYFILLLILSSCGGRLEYVGSGSSKSSLCGTDTSNSVTSITSVENFSIVGGIDEESVLTDQLRFYHQYTDVDFNEYQRVIMTIDSGYAIEFYWETPLSEIDLDAAGDVFNNGNISVNLYTISDTLSLADLEECMTDMAGPIGDYCSDFMTSVDTYYYHRTLESIGDSTFSISSYVDESSSVENQILNYSVIVNFDVTYGNDTDMTVDYPAIEKNCDYEEYEYNSVYCDDYTNEIPSCEDGYVTTNIQCGTGSSDEVSTALCNICTITNDSGEVISSGADAEDFDEELCNPTVSGNEVAMDLL